jgi:hypothetical protein
MKPIFNILKSILIGEYQNKASGWKNDVIFKRLRNTKSFDNNGFVSDLVNKAFHDLKDNEVKEYMACFIPDASKDEIDILKNIVHKKYPKYKDTLDNLLLLK